MTETNKQNIEKLIDLLSDKTLEFGCLIDWGEWGNKIKGRTTNIRPYTWFDHSDDEECLSPEEMKNGCYDKILGHPIMLTTVLEKMKCFDEKEIGRREAMQHGGWNELAAASNDLCKTIRLWQKCGFTKSLQEIMGCGFEEANFKLGKKNKKDFGETKVYFEKRLKDPQARELCEFLINLFLK